MAKNIEKRLDIEMPSQKIELFCAKNTVAGITKSRNDIRMLV